MYRVAGFDRKDFMRGMQLVGVYQGRVDDGLCWWCGSGVESVTPSQRYSDRMVAQPCGHAISRAAIAVLADRAREAGR